MDSGSLQILPGSVTEQKKPSYAEPMLPSKPVILFVQGLCWVDVRAALWATAQHAEGVHRFGD